MTVETPQPRDRVRWKRLAVVEGVVEEVREDAVVVCTDLGRTHVCPFEDATVEVLERADDPADPLAPLPYAPSFTIDYEIQRGAERRWVGQTGRVYVDRDGWFTHPEISGRVPVLAAWFFDGPMKPFDGNAVRVAVRQACERGEVS